MCVYVDVFVAFGFRSVVGDLHRALIIDVDGGELAHEAWADVGE